MGSNTYYYKQALSLFAYRLNFARCDNSIDWLIVDDINKLENEVLRYKNMMPEKIFYYKAGEVSESIVNECQSVIPPYDINGCAGGLALFDSLIEYDDEEVQLPQPSNPNILKDY